MSDRCPELPRDAVALLGLPWDAMSSHLRGAALAPAAIRRALRCDSRNLWTERGRDLGSAERFVDLGDLELPTDTSALGSIVSAVADLLAHGAKPLALGGDHAVTLGVLRACAARFPGLSVLQIDAHPDLYEEYDGNRFSHACPFARALEERLVARLVQVGIRTMNDEQRRQAECHGVEVIEARHVDRIERLELDGPIYVSVDLDGLDPAFAPGVSHPEPGGLSTRQVLSVLDRLPPTVVGADVVELNPERDVNDLTAAVAAKLVKELACRLLDGGDA